MTRPTTLLGVILTCSALFGGEPYKYSPQTTFPPSFHAVCKIAVPEERGFTIGSGTLVAVRGGRGLVLSCRHVCHSAGREAYVSWPLDGIGPSRGKVVRVLPGDGFNTDLALVECVAPKSIKPVPVVLFNPQRGPFIGCGWRDNHMRVSVPTINAGIQNGNLVRIDQPFKGGMSGGPLFDRYGRVTAVVVGSDRETYGVCTNGNALHNLLRSYGKR